MIRNPILLHCGAAVAVTIAVSWLDIRPLGVLFLILLALWIYKTRCSAAIKIILPQHINAKILEFHDRVVKLRKEHPGVFCGIVSSCLAVLAILGHMISGSSFVVFGLIAAGLVSTKYNFQILKVENKEALIWPETPDHDVDEFLPEVNESNLFVLQRASDQAIINPTAGEEEEKSDEIPADLLIPDSIPEIDEHSDSSDDELVLKPPVATLTPKAAEIEFKSGYFKSSISSSSSDDDSLSKGLNFQNLTVTDSNTSGQTAQQQRSQTEAQSSNVLPNLVTGLVTWSMGSQLLNLGRSSQEPPQIDKRQKDLTESSDESDFEIVDTDDLNSL